jgi:TolA-binding protein
LDEQNTDPGAPALRTALLEAVAPGEALIGFSSSSVVESKTGPETFHYDSTIGSEAPAVKSLAFKPPLTFEIIDPAAARDSFSEVKATLTTTGGSKVEVICPLASSPDPRKKTQAGRDVTDEPLETGRFVGQILMNLGDKDSPPSLVQELGDIRKLVARRNPLVEVDPQMAEVIPVLNLNGQDIITVTYSVNGKEITDQARLGVPSTIAFTDSGYEKPVEVLYVGDKVYMTLHDLTADATPERDLVAVKLSSSRGETFSVNLQETLSHSGDFTGSLVLVPNEKPTPSNDKMEAWFGDSITLSYSSKSNAAAKVEKTVNVVKGTDCNLLAFGKKYANESVAIDSQFRMAEAYFELFKSYRSLKKDADSKNPAESKQPTPAQAPNQENPQGTSKPPVPAKPDLSPEAKAALNDGMLILKELSNDYPSKAYEGRTEYLLGQFAQVLGQYDEAIGHYKKITINHPEHPLAPDAQFKLGQCYEEKGEMDAANSEYVILAYTWPENPLVANVIVRIADYFYNKGEFLLAADVSKKFVERFDKHEWADRLLFRSAVCWSKAEKFLQAAENFDRLDLDYPRSQLRPEAIFRAGEAYQRANKNDFAYRRYVRVTGDYPESQAAKMARGKLVSPEMVAAAEAR